jgi:hypothetical protein
MIPSKPTVLEGKTLKDFEEYENSIATKEELDWMEEAREHYKILSMKTTGSITSR